jgi:hypothetical protein
MTDIHQPLRDALKAGPTEGPLVFDEEDETIIDPNVPEIAVLTVERVDLGEDGRYQFGAVSKANAAFYAAANPAAISALLAERDAAVKALDDAATSIETISRLAGKATYPNGDDTCMGTFPEVRGYATSRAFAARAALSQIKAGREQA